MRYSYRLLNDIPSGAKYFYLTLSQKSPSSSSASCSSSWQWDPYRLLVDIPSEIGRRQSLLTCAIDSHLLPDWVPGHAPDDDDADDDGGDVHTRSQRHFVMSSKNHQDCHEHLHQNLSWAPTILGPCLGTTTTRRSPNLESVAKVGFSSLTLALKEIFEMRKAKVFRVWLKSCTFSTLICMRKKRKLLSNTYMGMNTTMITTTTTTTTMSIFTSQRYLPVVANISGARVTWKIAEVQFV